MQNETIEVLEGNMGEFFYNLGIEKAFLTMTEHLESIKKEIDKFSYKKKNKAFSMQK